MINRSSSYSSRSILESKLEYDDSMSTIANKNKKKSKYNYSKSLILDKHQLLDEKNIFKHG